MIRDFLFRFCSLSLWASICFGAGAQPSTPSLPLQNFDRYVVILDRKPFGVESQPPPVELLKIAPDKSFTAKYKMAAVTRNDSGTIQVGLVDLKSKQSVMLGIGDSIEGVEVVEADYVKERARLRRDPEDYWVSMSGGSNSFEVVGKNPTPQIQPGAPPAPVATTRTVAARSSYATRREARLRKELQQLQAIEAKRSRESKTGDATSVASVRAGRSKATSSKAAPISETGQALLRLLNNEDNAELSPEEVNSLLQQYQKELIRSGQTPLPIPLTPETDQELVNEGVLPTMDQPEPPPEQ